MHLGNTIDEQHWFLLTNVLFSKVHFRTRRSTCRYF